MELKIEGLCKQYGKLRALDKLNLTLSSGIYALLGPNGAGKSTLMNLLVCNLLPDAGNIRCDGSDIGELGKLYRARIGYMPQNQTFYPEFSARRYLQYIARLKGVPRRHIAGEVEQALKNVHLLKEQDRRLAGFSGGMRQRVLIAQALLNSPEFLILDEPTAGLDPNERIRIRNLIGEISTERTVLIATHVVSDIEQIAHKVILLKKGRLLACEAPERLQNSLRGHVYETAIPNSQLPSFKSSTSDMLMSLIKPEGNLTRLRYITAASQDPHNARSVFPDLEELYLAAFHEQSPLCYDNGIWHAQPSEDKRNEQSR